ncbi:MAG: hypothetical protein H6605_07660 [Flavobacteriales bacterium]|nr:hypothetical protein [Flavobacteriales bacterium]
MDLKQRKTDNLLIYAIMLSGIGLALVQFFYNRSIWLDEASLSLNILKRSFSGLFQPLDYIQVAPILFLQFEKMFSFLIPNSELGFRLLPLLFFIGSVYVFFKISSGIFKNKLIIAISLILFLLNPKIIYYSSEVKQYMCDVFFTLWMYYLVKNPPGSKVKKYSYLAVSGLVFIYFSNIAPFVLVASGILVLLDNFHKKDLQLVNLFAVSLVWAIGFLVYYFAFVYEHPSLKSQIFYFTDFGAFMPQNPFSAEFVNFFRSKYEMYFSKLLPDLLILPVFFIAGAYYLLKVKRSGLLLFFFIPVLIHLILSSLKMYPFNLRLVLYTGPILILIVSAGFEYLFSIKPRYIPGIVHPMITVSIGLFCCALFIRSGFPYKHEEVRSCIEFIDQNREENDKVLVYIGAFRSLKFYKITGKTALEPDQIVVNSEQFSNREFIDEYFAEDANLPLVKIDELKQDTGRTWILMGHYEGNEMNKILKQFRNGDHKEKLSYSSRKASAYLFKY